MIKVTNDKNKEIWLRDSHAHYVKTIIRDFDYYFDAVFGPDENIRDYSRGRQHVINGFDDFLLLCPSLPENYSAIRQYLEFAKLTKEDVVWDLGAYVGLFAIEASKEAFGVYALEPDSENWYSLLINLHKSRSSIIAYKCAISAFEGSRDFSSEGSMGSAFNHIVGDRGVIEKVDCYTLSTLPCPVPTFIKMDIEGAELEVIKEGGEFLREYKPRMIVEPHKIKGKLNTQKVTNLLRDIGYEVTIIEQKGIKSYPLITAEFK